MLNYTETKVTIEFIEPVLGTTTKNPEIYKQFIAEKTKNLLKTTEKTDEDIEKSIEEEMIEIEASLKGMEEKGWTGFLCDQQGYYVYNYWIRGFTKTATQSLMESGDLGKECI
ncbi:MAG: hypothetical protein HQK65_07875 [Desulfamplus sp.]|nr:hypothetical protein [Desulfamplus sp.]